MYENDDVEGLKGIKGKEEGGLVLDGFCVYIIRS